MEISVFSISLIEDATRVFYLFYADNRGFIVSRLATTPKFRRVYLLNNYFSFFKILLFYIKIIINFSVMA